MQKSRMPHLCKLNRMSATLTILLRLLTAPASAAELGQQNYEIPAQPLQSAINQLSEQADLQISFPAGLTQGKSSPGLSGHYTAKAALDKLLAGSGLVSRVTASNAFTLEKQPNNFRKTATTPDKPEPQSSGGSNGEGQIMPEVTVEADSAYDPEYYADPYNKDYVLPNATVGTKTDTPIMETPLNMQVISKQVLKDQQAFTFDKALKNVSGVTTTLNAPAGGGTYNTITTRGFETETYFRNGFRIDGGGQGGGGTRQFANVESVEVLKGAAAILYGRVEPGGIINITTKQPLSNTYYSLQQQFGSYDLYRTSADATGPLTKDKDLLYRMNLSYESSSSFREFIDNDRLFLAPVLKWNISPKTQVTFEMEYSRDEYGFDLPLLPLKDNHLIMLPRFRNLAEPLPNKTETFYGGLNWSHQFNDDWSLKHSISVNRVAANQNVLYLLGFPKPNLLDRMPVTFNDMTANYSTSLNLTGHFNTGPLKHTLLLGGDYYRTDYNLHAYGFSPARTFPIDVYNPVHFGTSILDHVDRNPYIAKQNIDQYGFYLQDQIKLPYDIHFLSGFRYQYIHQKGETSYLSEVGA